jgi:Spy/CpxP family protein refolding chaperone
MLMRSVSRISLLTALLVVTACELPTGSSSSAIGEGDYALVMFGEPGASLEGTMGPQSGPRPFDGRTGRPPLPDSLKLTDEQHASIDSLREAFRAEHQTTLDSLKAIFEEARAARLAGATREEVHAILLTGRPLADALRPDVQALHEAIRAVLTDAQRAWLDAHRRRHMPMGPRRGPG